mmetsp:Transcript_72418/g.130320  ORF Transcript_72418/g.130320 Transcript_72418/m.130320 type:complete len:347 (-) Transcript_72418:2395-3435(-)
MLSARAFQFLLAKAWVSALASHSSSASDLSPKESSPGAPPRDSAKEDWRSASGPDGVFVFFSESETARSPDCRFFQTLALSSATQTKRPALESSARMSPLTRASSSQGTALSKLIPSWPPARACTLFVALLGSKAQIRSSKPPLRAIICTRQSPEAARTLLCSEAAARSNKGSTSARRKRPDCCRPKAVSMRPSSFRLAPRHFGPISFSLRSLDLPWSARSRSLMRAISGYATSSMGTRPCRMQEQSASAAACCGEAALAEPPPASVWSSSCDTKDCSLSGERNNTENSSAPRSSTRASPRSSSQIVREAVNTLGILSLAAKLMTSTAASTKSAGDPEASAKCFDT